MSLKASRAAWAAKINDPQAKLVLLKLADCDDDKRGCYPLIDSIVASTELSERTVRRKIELLESGGWLTRDRQKRGTRYTLNLDSEPVTVTALEPDKQPGQSGQPDRSEPVTVTTVVSLTTGQPDRSKRSHRPVEPVTVTGLYRERPRTTKNDQERERERAREAEAIVTAYPRREKFATALELVRRDLAEGQTFAEMLKGTKAIADVIRSLPSGAANRYVPSAEAFFRDKRWQDDPASFRRSDPANGDKGAAKPMKKLPWEEDGYVPPKRLCDP